MRPVQALAYETTSIPISSDQPRLFIPARTSREALWPPNSEWTFFQVVPEPSTRDGVGDSEKWDLDPERVDTHGNSWPTPKLTERLLEEPEKIIAVIRQDRGRGCGDRPPPVVAQWLRRWADTGTTGV